MDDSGGNARPDQQLSACSSLGGAPGACSSGAPPHTEAAKGEAPNQQKTQRRSISSKSRALATLTNRDLQRGPSKRAAALAPSTPSAVANTKRREIYASPVLDSTLATNSGILGGGVQPGASSSSAPFPEEGNTCGGGLGGGAQHGGDNARPDEQLSACSSSGGAPGACSSRAPPHEIAAGIDDSGGNARPDQQLSECSSLGGEPGACSSRAPQLTEEEAPAGLHHRPHQQHDHQMPAHAASSSFGSGARSEACSSRAPQLTEEEAPAGMEVEAGVAAVRFEHKRAQL